MGLDGQDDCLRVTIVIAGTLVAHSVSVRLYCPQRQAHARWVPNGEESHGGLGAVGGH